MPKSKRDREISLTKVKRKGKEAKLKLVDEVRQCVDNYENIFAFTFDNARNNKLASIRTHFKNDGRLFLGKNKVMALALGRIPQEEYKDGLHRVSKSLNSQCGLLFTNKPVEDVIKYFKGMKEMEFARSGHVATETVELEAGPIEQFPFNLEPQLRKLGLPTKLEKGTITLTTNHVVCSAGDKLTPEQAKLLEYLGLKMAEFRIRLQCVWSKNEATADDPSAAAPAFKKLSPKPNNKDDKHKAKKKKSRNAASKSGAAAAVMEVD